MAGSLDPFTVIGPALCKAVGIDPNTVQDMEIRIAAGQPVQARFALYPTKEQTVGIKEAVATLALTTFTISRKDESLPRPVEMLRCSRCGTEMIAP